MVTARQRRKQESLKISATFFADRGFRQATKGDIQAMAILLRKVRDAALNDAILIVEKAMDPNDTLSSLEDAKAGTGR